MRMSSAMRSARNSSIRRGPRDDGASVLASRDFARYLQLRDLRRRSPDRKFSTTRSLSSLSAQPSKRAVADKPLFLLIPQSERERLQAREQRDWFDSLEQRLRFVTFFQMVIRNARTEMMNMVKSDVARKPLQHFGQFIK